MEPGAAEGLRPPPWPGASPRPRESAAGPPLLPAVTAYSFNLFLYLIGLWPYVYT